MASIDIDIAGRKFSVACRDGEEEHLRSVGALVDKRARDAAQALGSLSEARLLLFTSLLLADDLKELQEGREAAPALPPADDIGQAAEMLAERIEALADRLEQREGMSAKA
jgi:cell division protein ZapA